MLPRSADGKQQTNAARQASNALREPGSCCTAICRSTFCRARMPSKASCTPPARKQRLGHQVPHHCNTLSVQAKRVVEMVAGSLMRYHQQWMGWPSKGASDKTALQSRCRTQFTDRCLLFCLHKCAHCYKCPCIGRLAASCTLPIFINIVQARDTHHSQPGLRTGASRCTRSSQAAAVRARSRLASSGLCAHRGLWGALSRRIQHCAWAPLPVGPGTA